MIQAKNENTIVDADYQSLMQNNECRDINEVSNISFLVLQDVVNNFIESTCHGLHGVSDMNGRYIYYDDAKKYGYRAATYFYCASVIRSYNLTSVSIMMNLVQLTKQYFPSESASNS